MTPSLFAGTDAIDEYTFMATPDAAERLRRHHETWITEQDFAWLAGHGVQLVRLPVGHWVLADDPPYLGAPELLDAAMEWAAAYGLKVLLDLHAVSGSQNGQDHSGRVGPRALVPRAAPPRAHPRRARRAGDPLSRRTRRCGDWSWSTSRWTGGCGGCGTSTPMPTPAHCPARARHPGGLLRRVRAVAAAGEPARPGGPADRDRQPLLPGVLSVGRVPEHRVAHRQGAAARPLVRWLVRVASRSSIGEWSGGLPAGPTAVIRPTSGQR